MADLRTQFFRYAVLAPGCGRVCNRITAAEADRDYRHTDAGTDDEFIIEAPNLECAGDAGSRWVDNRANDDEACVPDDLALVERQWSPKPQDAYMILRVL